MNKTIISHVDVLCTNDFPAKYTHMEGSMCGYISVNELGCMVSTPVLHIVLFYKSV